MSKVDPQDEMYIHMMLTMSQQDWLMYSTMIARKMTEQEDRELEFFVNSVLAGISVAYMHEFDKVCH